MPIYMNCTRKNVQVIRGSVTEQNHVGWIELQSAQFFQSRSSGTVASNEAASPPKVSEIVVTKFQDQASTFLFRESLNGMPMQVTLHFIRGDGADPTVYLSITLHDTLISSYSNSGVGGGTHGQPLESVSLNFAKITYEHHQAGQDMSARVKSAMTTAQP